MKLVNDNQILGHVADQSCIPFIDYKNNHLSVSTGRECVWAYYQLAHLNVNSEFLPCEDSFYLEKGDWHHRNEIGTL